MEPKSVLLEPSTILSICSNLTFPEAIEFRTALKLSDLNCQITISDPDQQILYLPKVNDLTIQIYNDIQTRGSIQLLFDAIYRKNFEIVKLLLKISPKIANIVDDEGDRTPLILASEKGDLEMVKVLLNLGADPNFPNLQKMTALMKASERGYLKIVKLLLDQGAQVTQNSVGFSSLGLATVHNHPQIVQLLLENGANIQIDPRYKKGLFKLAQKFDYSETLNLLERAGFSWEN